jgi:hypothetical protein
MRAEEHET